MGFGPNWNARGLCEETEGGGEKKKKVSGHNSCWRKDHWRVRWVLH